MFFHQPASTHHAFIPACGSLFARKFLSDAAQILRNIRAGYPLSWIFASIASCWEEFAKHIPPHEAAIGNSPFC